MDDTEEEEEGHQEEPKPNEVASSVPVTGSLKGWSKAKVDMRAKAKQDRTQQKGATAWGNIKNAIITSSAITRVAKSIHRDNSRELRREYSWKQAQFMVSKERIAESTKEGYDKRRVNETQKMQPWLCAAAYAAVESGDQKKVIEMVPKMSEALGTPACEYQYGASGHTLLHVASLNKHPEIVRILIEDFGADVEAEEA